MRIADLAVYNNPKSEISNPRLFGSPAATLNGRSRNARQIQTPKDI
jgi:hypothetical protein